MGPEEQVPVALAERFFAAVEKVYPLDFLAEETRQLFCTRQNGGTSELISLLWKELPAEDRLTALLTAFDLRAAPLGSVTGPISKIPFGELEHNGYVPIEASERALYVATPFPWMEANVRSAAARDWRTFNQASLKVYVFYVPYDAYIRTVHQVRLIQSQSQTKANDVVAAMAGATSQNNIMDLDDQTPANEVLKPVLEHAVANHITDIHFGSQPNLQTRIYELRIQTRLDGLLEEFRSGTVRNGTEWTEVIRNRLSQIAGIRDDFPSLDAKIKLKVKLPGAKEATILDIRVAALSYQGGHDISLRLLDKSKRLPSLSEIFKYAPEAWSVVHNFLGEPDGILLMVGPTGSGKTTTLNTLLNELNNGRYHILTIEDPVEYETPGMKQFDVDMLRVGTDTDDKPGLDPYQIALKSFLRKDPDVILIGEVRDSNVAGKAVQAAVTGHQVFASMHVNSVVNLAERLNGMGIATKSFSFGLKCAVAQRLVPRLCSHCSKSISEDTLDSARHCLEKARLPVEWAGALTEGRAQLRVASPGSRCPVCNGRGYRGVVTAVEALPYNEPAVQELIVKSDGNPSSYEMMQLMREKKWPLMDISALRMIFAGVTDYEGAKSVISLSGAVRQCNEAHAATHEQTWKWEVK